MKTGVLAGMFLFLQHIVFRMVSVGLSLWAISTGQPTVIVIALILFALEFFQSRALKGKHALIKVYNFILIVPVIGAFAIHPWWLGVLETGLVVQAINTLILLFVSIHMTIAFRKSRMEDTTQTVHNEPTAPPNPTPGTSSKQAFLAEELGGAIANQIYTNATSLELPEGEDKIDINRYRLEMFLFEVFALDYVSFQKLNGNSPEKNAVLNAFYNSLNENGLLTQQLQNRIAEYVKALQTPPPRADLPATWELGKAFAKACNHENDAAYVMKGIMEFNNMITQWGNIYDQIQVTA